jgi:hypothetical protein
LNDRAAAVKAAMRAGSVGQHGFSAIGTAAPLRLGQMIMGAALVLDALRSSSFRYWHALILFFLRFLAAATRFLYNTQFANGLF